MLIGEETRRQREEGHNYHCHYVIRTKDFFCVCCISIYMCVCVCERERDRLGIMIYVLYERCDEAAEVPVTEMEKAKGVNSDMVNTKHDSCRCEKPDDQKCHIQRPTLTAAAPTVARARRSSRRMKGNSARSVE